MSGHVRSAIPSPEFSPQPDICNLPLNSLNLCHIRQNISADVAITWFKIKCQIPDIYILQLNDKFKQKPNTDFENCKENAIIVPEIFNLAKWSDYSNTVSTCDLKYRFWVLIVQKIIIMLIRSIQIVKILITKYFCCSFIRILKLLWFFKLLLLNISYIELFFCYQRMFIFLFVKSF